MFYCANGKNVFLSMDGSKLTNEVAKKLLFAKWPMGIGKK